MEICSAINVSKNIDWAILNINRKEAGQFNAICGGERCQHSLPQKCSFSLCKKQNIFTTEGFPSKMLR